MAIIILTIVVFGLLYRPIFLGVSFYLTNYEILGAVVLVLFAVYIFMSYITYEKLRVYGKGIQLPYRTITGKRILIPFNEVGSIRLRKKDPFRFIILVTPDYRIRKNVYVKDKDILGIIDKNSISDFNTFIEVIKRKSKVVEESEY
jgi:hypothetical protein